MKLSNLDESLFDPLTTALKQNKPTIKNVLLVTLESTRKDMFPFKKGTHAYDTILSSYGSPDAAETLDKKLRNLTTTASFLTGESTRFQEDAAFNGTGHLGAWASEFAGAKGGINVQGAVTGSAYTLKSLITSLCGMEPLPVDFTDEVRAHMYQPCLPHILSMLNKAEQAKGKKEDGFLSWPWDTAHVQSVTDQFDSQYILDDQIGFRTFVTDDTLDDPASGHYPPKEPRNNYFGYPETETLPYMRDLFANAKRDNRRLFVSHITSTTHHPFAVPAAWPGKETYMAKRRFAPEADEFESYLNTIKWQDGYLDSLLSMLHAEGALNETLVVMVGDHGLAFKASDDCKSNFENGHIANFGIPMLFLHPELPRVQLDVADAATPTSIIPTVLDLLLQTDSLSDASSEVAKGLLPRYQGHSMIREQRWSVPVLNHTSSSSLSHHDDRYLDPYDFHHPHDRNALIDASFPTTNVSANTHPFHFSTINPGGSLLAISQSHSPYRLVFPLCSTLPLRFTDLSSSPNEQTVAPLIAWSVDAMVKAVRARHGDDAAAWADLARRLGEWWFWEQRRRWGYHLPTRSTDRGVADGYAIGQIRKKHWWET